MRIAAVALVLALALAARSATIEVTVRERDGGTLPGVGLSLLPLPAAPGMRWLPGQGAPVRSGRDGKARFDNVAAGSYRIGIMGSLKDPALVRPEHNLLAPAPELTLVAADETLPFTLELWRGVPVTFEIEIWPGTRLWQGGHMVLRHAESGKTLEDIGTPRQDLPLNLALVPGRWTATLEAAPGILLTGLTVAGEPLEGHEAVIDLVPFGKRAYASFHFEAPAQIEGRISPPRAGVRATLVQAGPWLVEVERRGGSSYNVVTAGTDANGLYLMDLPDGRWLVEPVSPALVSSSPESVALALAPLDVGHADFAVVTGNWVPGDYVEVTVFSPPGQRVEGGVVAAWRLGDDANATPPLHVEHANKGGSALFRDLGKGGYRFRAWHADFVDGETSVPNIEAFKDRAVTIKLKPGAAIHGFVTDANGKGKVGASFSIEREQAFDPPLVDAALMAKKRRQIVVSDATGHVWARGLYPGRYRLRVTADKARAASIVRLTHDGRFVDELSLDVSGEETVEFTARVIKAATLSGRFVCDDDSAVPRLVDLRVVPAALASEDEAAALAGASLATDGLVLGGKLVDTLTAGPVVGGTWLVAVRPAGFDRWTWVYGGESPAEASVVKVEDGDVADLETIVVPCAPLVELVARVPDGQPALDLREAKVDARWHTDRAKGRLSIEARGDRLRLGAAPEGDVEVEVTLVHPYVLPSGSVTAKARLHLERGRRAPLVAELKGVGGAIEVRGEGVAARLRSPAGQKQLPLARGAAEFAALAPGSYGVDLCGDPDCAKIMKTWKDVVATRGKRVILNGNTASTP